MTEERQPEGTIIHQWLKDGERVRCVMEGIVCEKGLYIKLNPGCAHEYTVSSLFAGDITKIPHAPRELEVGELVTWGTRNVNFSVVAISKKLAWVRSDYVDKLMEISDLHRVTGVPILVA